MTSPTLSGGRRKRPLLLMPERRSELSAAMPKIHKKQPGPAPQRHKSHHALTPETHVRWLLHTPGTETLNPQVALVPQRRKKQPVPTAQRHKIQALPMSQRKEWRQVLLPQGVPESASAELQTDKKQATPILQRRLRQPASVPPHRKRRRAPRFRKDLGLQAMCLAPRGRDSLMKSPLRDPGDR